MKVRAKRERKQEPAYDTVSQFADHHNIGVTSVYRGIARGKIYAVKIIDSWRIPRTERQRIAELARSSPEMEDPPASAEPAPRRQRARRMGVGPLL
jgi:hypothetical protein